MICVYLVFKLSFRVVLKFIAMKINLKNLISTLFFLAFSFNLFSQVPAGFNYQAIARDKDGNPIPDADLKVRIGVLTTVTPPNVVYEAEYMVHTDAFGHFTLMVGDPLATPVSGTFKDVDWNIQPLYLRTMVYWKSNWEDMGSSKLLSVPYAIMAQGISGLDKLVVAGMTSNPEEALFEVKNIFGQTVFAVYNEGVRAYVGDGNKGVKGGFAIGGYDATKGSQEYLRVTSDSTRIYVKDSGKASKGGFAIGSFSAGKSIPENYLDITPANYFIGHQSGTKVTSGKYNSVMGYKAAHNLTTGNSNTILGHLADSALISGNNNIIIGQYAGLKLTSGNHNTLIGTSAGYNHSNQEYNVMIGTSSGYNINASGWSGSFNTFMGINSGYQIRNSRDNVFLGTNAGYWLDNGRGNTFVGIDAGRSRGEGSWPYRPTVNAEYNTFMGYRAGYNITNGDNNLAIGYEAGYSATDGTGNVFLGYQAGRNETGSDKLYIANSAANPLIYGDFAARQLGINTTSLTKTLNVGGDADISGTLSVTNITAQSINGMSTGRIYLKNNGVIISIDEGRFVLTWDNGEGIISLINNTDEYPCNYWAKKISGTVTTGISGEVPPKDKRSVISDTNVNNSGFEIHFGKADETGTLCSVWLQFFNGALVGHYQIY